MLVDPAIHVDCGFGTVLFTSSGHISIYIQYLVHTVFGTVPWCGKTYLTVLFNRERLYQRVRIPDALELDGLPSRPHGSTPSRPLHGTVRWIFVMEVKAIHPLNAEGSHPSRLGGVGRWATIIASVLVRDFLDTTQKLRCTRHLHPMYTDVYCTMC